MKNEHILVIATVVMGELEYLYNINADTMTKELAVTSSVEKLTLLTNVGGCQIYIHHNNKSYVLNMP